MLARLSPLSSCPRLIKMTRPFTLETSIALVFEMVISRLIKALELHATKSPSSAGIHDCYSMRCISSPFSGRFCFLDLLLDLRFSAFVLSRRFPYVLTPFNEMIAFHKRVDGARLCNFRGLQTPTLCALIMNWKRFHGLCLGIGMRIYHDCVFYWRRSPEPQFSIAPGKCPRQRRSAFIISEKPTLRRSRDYLELLFC